MTINITRIKYEDNSIKAFDGRSKVADLDTSDISEDDYFQIIENLESLLDEKGWVQDGKTWRQGEEGETMNAKDEASFAESMRNLEESDDEEDGPAKSEYYDEIDEETGKVRRVKRMHIEKDQRQRKSDKPLVTEALDDFCIIQLSPSRRELVLENLEQVAADNSKILEGKGLIGRNNGCMKMNLQNRLERLYRQGETIVIDGKEIPLDENEEK